MKLDLIFALIVALNKVQCLLQKGEKVRGSNIAISGIVKSLARRNHEITIFKDNASNELFESVAAVPHIV